MEEVIKALLSQNYLVAATVAAVLAMLITERGLATSKRMLEWKERAQECEQERIKAQEALRANNATLERMADVLSEANRINQVLLQERER